MSDDKCAHQMLDQDDVPDGRRRQLRALLLTAADAARQGRRIPEMASRMATPVGRAVRDRVLTLLTAAR
jgi:hypothetical protein